MLARTKKKHPSTEPPNLNPKGGGVGPHTDSYDVFLVQGMGVREWSISHKTIDANNEDLVIPDINVRVLKNAFKADEK